MAMAMSPPRTPRRQRPRVPTTPMVTTYDHTEPYDHNAGFYRGVHIEDLSRPWLASPMPPKEVEVQPLSPSFELPTNVTPSSYNSNSIRSAASGSATLSPTSPTSASSTPTVTISVPNPNRKLGLWKRILQFVRSGNFSAVETVKLDIPIYAPSPSDALDDSLRVKPNEWKEYGYYARPFINGMECPNSPAPSEAKSISTTSLQGIIRNLRDPVTGEKHPERWVAGLKHRSLPTRPARWTLPAPGEPLAFPWEVQLNPLLIHPLWGPSPLSWSLSVDPSMNNAYHGRVAADVPLAAADRAQPATYPFLTHMHFNAVAGDSAPTWPWPFTVENVRGVKVADVLRGIYEAFQTPVSLDERTSWPRMRQYLAEEAWKRRCKEMSLDTNVEPRRRCDSLGAAFVFFRGIEPSIDGGGWMITFGTQGG